MRHLKKALAAALCVSALGSATAEARKAGYEVTITNVTGGQIISPVAVVAHTRRIALFTLGEAASKPLAELAEGGNPEPLLKSLDGNPAVLGTNMSDGGIMPGDSATVLVKSHRAARISIAGMLVSTNDAFVALNGAAAPRYGSVTRTAVAYDAGSEANDELCASIPGPPCDGEGPSPGESDGDEGYVYVHPGVHGGFGLDPSVHDWRNPVAIIKIRRVWLR